MGKKKGNVPRWAANRHRESEFLRKIQDELMPDHAMEFLAINLETGEYALAKLPHQASTAFLERWPDAPMFLCRVDGGPAAKFYGM